MVVSGLLQAMFPRRRTGLVCLDCSIAAGASMGWDVDNAKDANDHMDANPDHVVIVGKSVNQPVEVIAP